MTTDLVALPSKDELDTIWNLARRLAETEFVPKSLRGRAEATMACILYGRELGIGPMQALQSIAVIEGKPSAAPELMRALILRAGHTLEVLASPTEATIEGKRCDNGSHAVVTFSLQDAVRAKLVQLKDGKPFARSQSGKALPWETYTEDMLVARATSRIARRLFSDVISGVSYTPEEMSSVGELEVAGNGSESRQTTLRPPPDRVAQLPTPQADDDREAAAAYIDIPSEPATGAQEPVRGAEGPPGSPAITDPAQMDLRELTEALDTAGLALTGTRMQKALRLAEFRQGVAPAEVKTPPEPTARRFTSAGVTEAQVTKISILFGEKGLAEEKHQWMSDFFGRLIASTKDLTQVEGAELITELDSLPVPS